MLGIDKNIRIEERIFKGSGYGDFGGDDELF